MNLDADHFFYKFVQEHTTHITLIFACVTLGACMVVGIYSFFFSHRIAGPLENIKLCFKKLDEAIEKGELDKLNETAFRKGDFFHEFAQAYNEHLKRIKSAHLENEDIVEESKILPFKDVA